MSETLGQVAYDAHWGFYDEVSDSPKRWSTHADECDMAAWQAAAEAVVAQHETDNHSPEIQVRRHGMSNYTSEEVTEMAAECVDLRQTVEAWAPVIEAAEAWADDNPERYPRAQVLIEAVRALQEARDET